MARKKTKEFIWLHREGAIKVLAKNHTEAIKKVIQYRISLGESKEIATSRQESEEIVEITQTI